MIKLIGTDIDGRTAPMKLIPSFVTRSCAFGKQRSSLRRPAGDSGGALSASLSR